ncbi:MAG: acetylornithine deacetylase [Alphaproteobacteria bacterium]|nr:MAG: acetylornithine deacetylase [Alphaproteobacteria bacterium]
MIERLIAFDTTSRLSNLSLIHWVRDYLAQHGIAAELTHDAAGEKANLFATIGPTDVGGIVLSGHTDVVPVDGQPWTTDPFQVVERDGRLYGRGTSDMKSFVAACLALVPHFTSRPLSVPIHLAFSFDEEVGCRGVPLLLAEVAKRPVRPRGCIVGEPTNMRVVDGHKGKLSLRCDVRGLECHSSLVHLGVNAVEYAAEAIAFLKAMARRKKAEGPHDARFDPPHTSVHVGTVAGGTALNIVPLACGFDFEFRTIPGEDASVLLAELETYVRTVLEPEMHAVDPTTGFTIEEVATFPGLDTPEDSDIVTLAKQLAGQNHTEKVPYGTEAGLFQATGIPTVVCGPGSIEQAHKPNEFIDLSQVAQCEAFLLKLLERCAR